MKAIKISYLSATNTRPSRYKATIKDGQGIIASITEGFDYGLSHDEQPKRLAQKLIDKMGWNTEISGIGAHGDDYFVTIK